MWNWLESIVCRWKLAKFIRAISYEDFIQNCRWRMKNAAKLYTEDTRAHLLLAPSYRIMRIRTIYLTINPQNCTSRPSPSQIGITPTVIFSIGPAYKRVAVLIVAFSINSDNDPVTIAIVARSYYDSQASLTMIRSCVILNSDLLIGGKPITSSWFR